jgi:hypothetical protein
MLVVVVVLLTMVELVAQVAQVVAVQAVTDFLVTQPLELQTQAVAVAVITKQDLVQLAVLVL